MNIVSSVGGPKDLSLTLVPALEKIQGKWGGCLDHRQVWNQSRPPWLTALIHPLESVMMPVVETVIPVLQCGANMDHALSLSLECLCELTECFPASVFQAAELLEEILPADIHPLGDSVLLQLVIACLYSQLAAADGADTTALCEALCTIDQNTKHVEKLQAFQIALREMTFVKNDDFATVEDIPHMSDMLVSSLLFNAYGRQSLKVMWQFVQHAAGWIQGQLGVLEVGQSTVLQIPSIPAVACRPKPKPLLHTMFHVGYRHFDQILAGTWELDWNALLQTPLSITVDRLWTQLSHRSEFCESPSLLSTHDATVVATLTAIIQALQFSP